MSELLLSKAAIHDDVYLKKIDDNVAAFTIKPIQFHASSFFKLDLSIVTGIIASIATYLIVVIQFRLSEEQGRMAPSAVKNSGSGKEAHTSLMQIVQG